MRITKKAIIVGLVTAPLFYIANVGIHLDLANKLEQRLEWNVSRLEQIKEIHEVAKLQLGEDVRGFTYYEPMKRENGGFSFGGGYVSDAPGIISGMKAKIEDLEEGITTHKRMAWTVVDF